MCHTAIPVALAVSLAAASPALAGSSVSFGVGVGFGPAFGWGPPPIYYEPYPYAYGPPPVVIEPVVPANIIPPGAVLDALEEAGYYDLSPMAHRGSIYKLNAVNPGGDLVQLEISVYTGEIERERILALSRTPQLAPTPAPIAPAPPTPGGDGEDPLVIY
jgi:hypothetical protein